MAFLGLDYLTNRADNLLSVYEGVIAPMPSPLTVRLHSMSYNSNYAIPSTYHTSPSSLQASLGSVCTKYGGSLISPMSFYQELFPSSTIESPDKSKSYRTTSGHLGNPLLLAITNTKDKEGNYHVRRLKRIFLNDYKMVDGWKSISGLKHVYMSGLTYLGKQRDLAHAVSMHALIVDLDYMTPVQLNRLLYGCDPDIDVYPTPNYIVLSGSGIHVYYTFAEPLPLYHGTYGRKVKAQLNTLKMGLTRTLWNPNTVGKEYGDIPQYQSINQCFRMVGSYTKSQGIDNDRYPVIAYKFPTKPYDSLDKLYDHAYFENPETVERYNDGQLSSFGLDYWKEHNPEWYERRIVKGIKEPKYWHMDRALYDWWLKKVRDGVSFGHRYNCLFCSVVYGVKCDVPDEEIEKDLKELLPYLSSLKPEDPITEDDMYEALFSRCDALNTFPVKSIEYLSGIRIKGTGNRRNGRGQAEHLKMARFIRDEVNGHKDTWRNGAGRHNKQDIIQAWREANPDGKKAQCIRDTGLDKKTVYKWWG